MSTHDELRELVTHYRRGLSKIIRTRHNRACELRTIALECLTHKADSFPEAESLPPEIVEMFRAEIMSRFSNQLSMNDVATFAYYLADLFERNRKASNGVEASDD